MPVRGKTMLNEAFLSPDQFADKYLDNSVV
jgi:hypothetical protein